MKLSGYQQAAIDRLLEAHRPTPTFACYDAPGIGKTAIALNAHLQLNRFPVLVTVPAHLVLQWRDELIRWGIPESEIGYCPRGMSVTNRLSQLAADHAFQLVSYNMWSSPRYKELLLHRAWQAYTFDEAHRLRKGRKGKGGIWTPISHLRTKTRSKHLSTPLWMLSGTPIVKDATDVWPLLHLANPYRFTSRQDFALETCRVSQTPYGLHVGPVRNVERFHTLLGRYSIRRTWREIPELTGLQRRDIPVPVELDPRELNRHRTIKRDYRDPQTGDPIDSSAAMIHALRRLTIPVKVEAFTELLEDSLDRFLALAWYKDSARMAFDRVRNYIAKHPDLKRTHIVYIDGTTPERERQQALATYHKYPDTILIGTLAALETGLNLQHGYQVVFLEQHWLSTTNEQAVARVLRRGQTQPVLVYWLHCPRTYDMRVKRVADGREASIEQALSGFLDEEDWTG